MDGDAGNPNARQPGRLPVNAGDVPPIDAELVFAFAGGDLFMGRRIDVRVDPDGDVGVDAKRRRDARKGFQFRHRFDIDLHDPGIERGGHFRCCLADAGKNDLRRRHPGNQGALQLAPRNHVGAGPQPGQGGDHGEVGIGLDGVADGGVESADSFGEDPVMALQGGRRIAVKGRADIVGDPPYRHRLGAQFTIGILKMVHFFAPVRAVPVPGYLDYLDGGRFGYSYMTPPGPTAPSLGCVCSFCSLFSSGSGYWRILVPFGWRGDPFLPQAANGAAIAKAARIIKPLRIIVLLVTAAVPGTIRRTGAWSFWVMSKTFCGRHLPLGAPFRARCRQNCPGWSPNCRRRGPRKRPR